MSLTKSEIIKNLDILLKKNNFIYDIWFYGSFSDQISDLDIIIVYKKYPKKLKLPSLLKEKMYGGTIIYIPKKLRFDIFLFEKLNIFSIKNKLKIKLKLKKNFLKLRLLTSFLERYYERRTKLINIRKKITENNIRDIKSVIMSYETFYQYCRYKNIKISKINLMEKYIKIRKKYILKKNKSPFLKFINILKKFDKKFKKNSLKILNKNFIDKSNSEFNFKFNNLKFNYNYKSENDVPFIYGCLYDFYAKQNLSISKKIKKDFKTLKIRYQFKKIDQIFLKKRINFLNQCFIDLKSKKFKSGLYRLTWYL